MLLNTSIMILKGVVLNVRQDFMNHQSLVVQLAKILAKNAKEQLIPALIVSKMGNFPIWIRRLAFNNAHLVMLEFRKYV